MRPRPQTALLLSGIVAVLAAGCSGADPASPAQNEPTTTVASIPPGVSMGAASLDDARGDGANADILHAVLAIGEAGLTVTYDLADDVPVSGTLLLAVTVSSEDGSASRQLGAKWVAGEPQPTVFVSDSGTASQESIDSTPSVTAGSVIVTYPASAVAELGDSFTWYAVSNVDGNDVDRAPDAESATFPGA